MFTAAAIMIGRVRGSLIFLCKGTTAVLLGGGADLITGEGLSSRHTKANSGILRQSRIAGNKKPMKCRI